MARNSKSVSNARIYLDTYKLFNEILDVTADFPKYYKYSIGQEMQQLCVTLLHLVSAAYLTSDMTERISKLTEFHAKFEVLRTLVRVSGEREWIRGISRHANIIELMNDITKQASAWKNSLVQKISKRDGV